MRAHRGRKIYDYYDVAVIKYSGDEVEFLSSHDRSPCFTPINKIYKDIHNYLHLSSNNNECRFFAPKGGDGAVLCKFSGYTPMYKAMESVYDLVNRWCTDEANAHSLPPMVINISDGMTTDCDYVKLGTIIDKIKGSHTEVGPTVVFNIFVSSNKEDNKINYPTDTEIKQIKDQYVASMASLSSYIPRYLFHSVETTRQVNHSTDKYRAFIHNIDLADLIGTLTIGTTNVVTR